jgi:hypothetical protein
VLLAAWEGIEDMHPVGVDRKSLQWMEDSIERSHGVGEADYTGFVKDEVYFAGTIFFVDQGQKYHVTSCMPCGRQYNLCPEQNTDFSIKVENAIPLTTPEPATMIDFVCEVWNSTKRRPKNGVF